MVNEPWFWMAFVLIAIAVLANVFMFGVLWHEKQVNKRIDKVLKDYYPLGRKVEILRLKWLIREELGIEHPKNERRTY